jgi:hypothetical protein
MMISNSVKNENFEENYALLGYYTASNGNFLPTFRDDPSNDGTDRLSRNVGKKLPLLAA